jgi:GNAT superfamily N-acetyltransferase
MVCEPATPRRSHPARLLLALFPSLFLTLDPPPTTENILVMAQGQLNTLGTACETCAFCYHHPGELGGAPSYLVAEVFVQPDARGFGFGEFLFAAALAAGAAAGFQRAHLMVCSQNTAARSHPPRGSAPAPPHPSLPWRRLYQKYGFRDSTHHSDDATHDKIMVCTRLRMDTIVEQLRKRLVSATPGSKAAKVPTALATA